MNALPVLLLSLLAVTASSEDTDMTRLKIDAPGCGQQNPPYTEPVISTFVINGQEAPLYEYPYICLLYHGTMQLCGGALITNRTGDYWFVTAAHCTESGLDARYSIRCGIHDTKGPTQPFEFSPKLLRPIVHEGYTERPRTYESDIAVFPLDQTGFPRERIGPVCMTTKDPTPGENAIVLGWGNTRETSGLVSAYSPTLQIAYVKVLSDRLCRDLYGNQFYTSTMMCAGVYPQGGNDACQGDSGGPLVVNRNGELQLIGVISFGYGCGRAGLPGLYTDVMKLKSWINFKINSGEAGVVG